MLFFFLLADQFVGVNTDEGFWFDQGCIVAAVLLA